MIESLPRLLGAQLEAMGCFTRLPARLDEMQASSGISPRYARWFSESVAALVRHGVLSTRDGKTYTRSGPPSRPDEVWQEWEGARSRWTQDPNTRALTTLAETTIKALPDILVGRQLATDVLFSRGSMSLVEGVYKHNPVADFFNDALARSVVAYAELLREQSPGARVRILEIGAGTGGATAHVLAMLRTCALDVEEYCFTDVSPAFLQHAEKTYSPGNPFLTRRLLDIDVPLEAQGIPRAHFDIVLASNVLHATPDIRRTLRNAKAALAQNGLLILNEISHNTLFAHLTFGLLDGWWSYEDEDLRIPGCPALAPETWKAVLESEGFSSVFFPAADAHERGQQVIIAESDGVIQPISPRAQRQRAPEPRPVITDATSIEERVRDVIKACVAKSLKVPESQIQVDYSFADYGVDSIIAVNLSNAINDACGTSLPTTTLFDYNSVAALSQFIAQNHGAEASRLLDDNPREAPVPPREVLRDDREAPLPAAVSSLRKTVAVATAEEPIAIVGMSARFAQSDSVEALWRHLEAGRDLVEDVRRWDLASHYASTLSGEGDRCMRGSFIEGIDHFDPSFFNISALEARCMDPQQRLFLEESYKALEDAGYAGSTPYHQRCGVYVGCANGDYATLLPRQAPAQAFWGNASSVIPARIAYFLNLQGPALAVDTACSSSLIAIHLACQGLWRRETNMALAGGVHLNSTPTFYVLSSRGGMLSRKGRCGTFSDEADGFVPGEGVGVVVLKRLSDAIADGDHVRGVIRGTGVNQDGTTNGLTAPSGKSQERLEREVYERFGVNPEDIQMVEAHGTGTRLGDPIEFDALTKSFGAYTRKRGYCALGSIKTNLGHTATAAGVAGIIKVLLSMQHRKIPASLHCNATNPAIDLERSPFFVNTQTRSWDVEPGKPRCAAVSSFGFSGTNGHVILEEAPFQERRISGQAPGYLIALSAHTAAQLKALVERLPAHLKSERIDCGDISQTLLLGRRHLAHRLACVVRDERELSAALETWLAKGRATGVHVSEVNENTRREQAEFRRYGNACIQQCAEGAPTAEYLEKLAAIADLHLQGYTLELEGLFRAGRSRRVPLPSYPFARESYWVAGETPLAERQPPPAPQRLHPMLHRNGAGRDGTGYVSTLSGNEPFLADHQVNGNRVLPAVAYLEMARAAVVHRTGATSTGDIRLSNVVWSQPIVVNGVNQEVHLTLDGTSEGGGAFSFEVQTAGAGQGNRAVLHSQGQAQRMALPRPQRVDLGALRAACGRKVVAGGTLYTNYQRLGLQYGPAHQSVCQVYVGDGQVLAEVVLPDGVAESDAYILHPSVLDGALQAIMCLHPGGDRGELPFALKELQVFSACARPTWAWIRRSPDNEAPSGRREGMTQRYDLDLCDDQGRVAVVLRGFSTRPVLTAPVRESADTLVGDVLVAPVWETAVIEPEVATPSATQHVLAVGARDEVAAGLAGRCGRVERLVIDEGDSIERIRDRLRGLDRIDHVVWVAPEEPLAFNEVAPRQSKGVLSLFRLVKALLSAGHGSSRLEWTVVTYRAQSTGRGDEVDPTHAAVHGLIGSMAKEYGHWKVRLVDLPDAGAWRDAALWDLPFDAQGNAVVYRQGQWHRQKLLPVDWDAFAASTPSVYRDGGVYVVIGGAGGLGGVWTEFMIRKHRAHVYWLGRRPVDADIEARLRELGALGPRPTYLCADAADEGALREAYRKIREQHSAIHGVVHSAIVLRDQSLAAMDEDRFRASLAAKVETSIHMARVFQQEPLDFIVFFSSINSFTKAPGQSNYAAGCTFVDALASHMAQTSRCAVKTLNWGYWGNVGIVATEEYRRRMEQFGIGSLAPAEAMKALETHLCSPLEQVGMLKTTRPTALAGVSTDDRLSVQRGPARASLVASATRGAAARAAGIAETKAAVGLEAERLAAVESLLVDLLAAQLHDMGPGVASSHRHWFDESMAILARRGYVAADGTRFLEGKVPDREQAWARWTQSSAEWRQVPTLRAVVGLLEPALRALPDIITGKRRTTDVIFPGGRMTLVEDLYKHNPVSDFFNQATSAAVADCVAERVRSAPSAGLRVLEIGAGTGSTTASVLAALAPYRTHVAEYCFTDVSKAFLLHAREAYGAAHSFMRFQLFDVSRPLAAQDLEQGAYDIVIASNVIHATSDVRESLRNAKAALAQGGVLALNELTANTLMAHLTFGLLDGWWAFADKASRLPGGPALSPSLWKRALEREGYRSVAFPVEDAHHLGQQIVLAESDGIVRQPRAARTKALTGRVEGARHTVAAPAVASPKSTGMSGGELRAVIQDCLAACVEMAPAAVANDRKFTEYGVDSIIAVKLVNAIGQRLGLVLETTLLFDHGTVDELADALVARYGAQLQVSRPLAKQAAPAPRPEVPAAPGLTPSAEAPLVCRVLLERPGQVDDVKRIMNTAQPLGDREVRVAVRAFSLNFGDLLCIKGLYPTMPPYPFTPGFDASGVVVEIGAAVRSLKPGDAVVAGMGEVLGAHATSIVCSESRVFLKPANLSFEEACALPAVSITMIDAFKKADLQPGERILIQTATGGTGLIAVQLAQLQGAEIFATAGSAEKLEYLKRLGVPHCINYLEEDFEAAVKQLTHGEGVDVVINTLSGAAIQKGVRCLRPGGRYIELAMTAIKSEKSFDLSVLNDNQTFFSLDLRKLARSRPDVIARHQQEFVRLVEEGKLRATIHRTFPFSDVQSAYKALEDRKNIGKIVVTIDPPHLDTQDVSAPAAVGRSTEPLDLGAFTRFQELVRLNGSTEGRPIFWFHGGMGGVEVYRALSQEIRRPFLGIQARGWMSQEAPIAGIEAMASYYVDILLAAQPEGPYELGGYSLGGMLAYEVTRQLQERGARVASIIMLDAPDSTHLDVFQFSRRTATFQAVNTALFASIAHHPERLEQTLIHRDEVEADLDDAALLHQLMGLAQSRGLSKDENQVRFMVEQNARVHAAYDVGRFRLKPLLRPEEVAVFYLRNGSCSFFGNLEPYLTLMPGELTFDGTNYWAEWERFLPRMQILEVASSNHLMLLAEPAVQRVIAGFCARFYGK